MITLNNPPVRLEQVDAHLEQVASKRKLAASAFSVTWPSWAEIRPFDRYCGRPATWANAVDRCSIFEDPTDQPFKLADTGGLHRYVTSAGGLWRYRDSFSGEEAARPRRVCENGLRETRALTERDDEVRDAV